MGTRTALKKLSILCSGTLLMACADLNLQAPLSMFTAGAETANEAYLQGRQQHLAQRYDEAIKSYQAALAAEAGHVNARNGLAALYAEKGDYAQAIPLWRALTEKVTMASGPSAGFLFSNLGYAYYLTGDYAQAVPALEKACLLDPLNHRAWQHLGSTLQKLGQHERARQMYRQAIALREHDFRADYAAAGGSGSAAIATAVKATPRPEPGWAAVEVRVAPDGMLELKRTPATRVAAPSAVAQPMTPAPAAAPIAASAPDSAPLAPSAPSVPSTPVVPVTPSAPSVPLAQATPRVALLEIRNGNGVTGMARALSKQMGDPELKVVRLTNDKGFNVRTTRVEYLPAYREEAERLAERFGSARVVQVDNVRSSHMRLVIGHDLRGKFALRPVVRPQQVAELAQLAQP